MMLDNLKGYSVMLVSGSPRRKELLMQLGLSFEIGRSAVEESYPATLGRTEISVYLSNQKALNCSPAMKPNNLIIAADTIVWHQGKVLGKPQTTAEAEGMLRSFSGQEHDVITGVTIRTAQEINSFYAETHVRFAELTEEEIAYYVHTYKPMDKAGSYGIQEWIGMVGVKQIQGSFYNVMGLPVARLYEELKKIKPCC